MACSVRRLLRTVVLKQDFCLCVQRLQMPESLALFVFLEGRGTRFYWDKEEGYVAYHLTKV